MLKAALKESGKEVEAFRGASRRLLESHEVNLGKQSREHDAQMRALAKKPLPVASLLSQIAQMTRAVADEEPAR